MTTKRRLCIKIYNFSHPTRTELEEIEHDNGEPGFADWCERQDNPDPHGVAWNTTVEDGLRRAEEDARAIFGPCVSVYTEGRSGGWLVVEDLPDEGPWPEVSTGWTAGGITLGPEDSLDHRWSYFEACAAAALDDFPRTFAELVCLNVYSPIRETEGLRRELLARGDPLSLRAAAHIR